MLSAVRHQLNRLFPLALALSLSVSSVAMAGPGDVNSVNNGQTVVGGTYYNTSDSMTTFMNSGSGGLHIGSETLVRGLEVNNYGDMTGNGGTLNFYAPGSVIRIDGTIDVSAIKNGSYYYGNGGKAIFTTNFLYQNGNIIANGANGGLVQFNVGNAVFGSNSRTEAQGFGYEGYNGLGGQIVVNAPGVVSVQRGALLATNGGALSGTYDTNLINIEGGVVNIEGVLQANGIATYDSHACDDIDSELIYGERGYYPSEYAYSLNGGTIRLVAHGKADTECATCALSKAASLFDGEELAFLEQTVSDLVEYHNGDVVIGQALIPPTIYEDFIGDDEDYIGYDEKYIEDFVSDEIVAALDLFGESALVEANGGNSQYVEVEFDEEISRGSMKDSNYAGSGGTIILSAVRDVINNNSDVRANGGDAVATGDSGFGQGGNGGNIFVTAQNKITSSGSFHAYGGNGYQNYRGLNETEQGQLSDSGILYPEGYTFDNQDDQVGGTGGNGGVIAFSYGEAFENVYNYKRNGLVQDSNEPDSRLLVGLMQIDAKGGHNAQVGEGYNNAYGGIVAFSGPQNPNRFDNVSVFRGRVGHLQTSDKTRDGLVLFNDPTGDATPLSLVDIQSQLAVSNQESNGDDAQVKTGFTNDVEILVNGDSAIMLAKNLGDTDLISLASASGMRFVGQFDAVEPFFPEMRPRNLVVASLGTDSLRINVIEDLTPNTWTISHLGNLWTDDDLTTLVAGGYASGGHISVLAAGGLGQDGQFLTYGQFHGGTINLTSVNGNVTNALLNSYYDEGLPLFGSNVILKAAKLVSNSGVINTDGVALGGNIWLQGEDVLNTGYLSANAVGGYYGTTMKVAPKIIDCIDCEYDDYYYSNTGFGGTINVKASRYAINSGLMTANAYNQSVVYAAKEASLSDIYIPEYDSYGNGYGGYIHQHGGALSLNGVYGQTGSSMLANGASNGGQILLTAGGSTDESLNYSVLDLYFNIAGGGITYPVGLQIGLTTKQLTPPVTFLDPTIDTTIVGSAISNGSLEALGGSEGGDGKIYVAGNGQAGFGNESSLMGKTLSVGGIVTSPNPNAALQAFGDSVQENGGRVYLVAGTELEGTDGKVRTAVEAVACAPLDDGHPNVNPNDSQQGAVFTRDFALPDDVLTFDLFGLFQQQRYIPDTKMPNLFGKFVLAMGDPTMFSASQYQPITEEILALAMEQYDLRIAQGKDKVDAFNTTMDWLQQAGITPALANNLLNDINAGKFTNVGTPVVDALNKIASLPAPAGQELTQ